MIIPPTSPFIAQNGWKLLFFVVFVFIFIHLFHRTKISGMGPYFKRLGIQVLVYRCALKNVKWHHHSPFIAILCVFLHVFVCFLATFHRDIILNLRVVSEIPGPRAAWV